MVNRNKQESLPLDKEIRRLLLEDKRFPPESLRRPQIYHTSTGKIRADIIITDVDNYIDIAVIQVMDTFRASLKPAHWKRSLQFRKYLKCPNLLYIIAVPDSRVGYKFIQVLSEMEVKNISIKGFPYYDTLTAQVQEGGLDFGATNWESIDRKLNKLTELLANKSDEENYRHFGVTAVALLEELCSLLIQEHPEAFIDYSTSKTDVKQVLDLYLQHELSGKSFIELRGMMRKILDLANALKHRSKSTELEAKICGFALSALLKSLKELGSYHKNSHQ